MLNDAAIESFRQPGFLSPARAASSDDALKVRAGGAVSWGAVLAGAAACASVSLILLLLGAGLGLAAASPWARDGLSAGAFGVSAIAWTTFSQVVAAGLGGYLSGRLRSRWISVEFDEVYFRDTAHGFLAWAIATLSTAALLGAAAAGLVGSATRLGASLAGDVLESAVGTPAAPTLDYEVDGLFRPAPTGSSSSTSTGGGEAAAVSRILSQALLAGGLPDTDARHAAELVSQRTGASAADAEKRVRDSYGSLSEGRRAMRDRAKEAADHARKVSSYAALWLFISLLIGAFVASVTAIWGGRRRDL